MGKVFVAGHNGMVGSALVRELRAKSVHKVIVADRSELDLCNGPAVYSFFQKHLFDHVYLAAARVGGIIANNCYPADFISDNIAIQHNIISAAHASDVRRLLFLGSSCIYPKFSEQPIRESCLLTGALEPTNEPYAIAKIAGIKTCESFNRQHQRDYRCVMPTNLFGPGDNFHTENSHVIPALIRRFHEAKKMGDDSVVIWGSGKPKREFLHVDDLASACLYLMSIDKTIWDSFVEPRCCHVNVGTGEDCSIGDLAVLIAGVVGFHGQIVTDTTKPDGTPRKLLDVSLLHRLGWFHKRKLKEGLKSTYEWFLENESNLRV